MDKYDKRRLNNIKEGLINSLESGNYPKAEQQYMLINNTVNLLLGFKELDTVCDQILKYQDDQEKLEQQIKEKNKEIQKLYDEYGENVTDIYENLIKKL